VGLASSHAHTLDAVAPERSAMRSAAHCVAAAKLAGVADGPHVDSPGPQRTTFWARLHVAHSAATHVLDIIAAGLVTTIVGCASQIVSTCSTHTSEHRSSTHTHQRVAASPSALRTESD
jgi:hypothetical protein